MGTASHKDIGAYIATHTSVTPTQLAATADTAGSSVDVSDAESIVIYGMLDAAASGDEVQFDLQESSDDGSSDAFANTGDSITVTADGSGAFAAELDVDVSGYEGWLRLNALGANQTINGTDIRFAATITVGGHDTLPQ